jgi:ABC-type antimicrobial peptide transport system permease subunit
MNNDLRTASILFGQITSSIIAILVIWVWGDSETGKNLFSYFWFQPFAIKILLSFLILVGSIISLYRILKLLPKESKNDGEGRDDR